MDVRPGDGVRSWENRSRFSLRIGSLRTLVEQHLEYESDFGYFICVVIGGRAADWKAALRTDVCRYKVSVGQGTS